MGASRATSLGREDEMADDYDNSDESPTPEGVSGQDQGNHGIDAAR